MKPLLILLCFLLMSCGDGGNGNVAVYAPEKNIILTVADLPKNSNHYWVQSSAIFIDSWGRMYADASVKVSTVKDSTHTIEVYTNNDKLMITIYEPVKWQHWPKSTININGITDNSEKIDMPVEKGLEK